jgi:hypothetical protein
LVAPTPLPQEKVPRGHRKFTLFSIDIFLQKAPVCEASDRSDFAIYVKTFWE